LQGYRSGGTIASASHELGQADAGTLSLLFAKGKRPGADAIARLSRQAAANLPGFSVSHRPKDDSGWLELLINGLAFDCRGLAPGESTPLPEPGMLLGLEHTPECVEAIGLAPGPHLANAGSMLPVVRAQFALAARLAELPGLTALCWQPACSWMGPEYFRRIIGAWLAGGAFPALGLTSLDVGEGGVVRSVGLGFLIGQEVAYDPRGLQDRHGAARLALRLIHELATTGAVSTPCEFTGPEGQRLLARPVRNGRLLEVTAAD
jgi:hypothetical protein